MQVASLKINLWRFCIIVPGSQVHACRGTCIWKEQMNHHSGVHLMPQLSSCHFPVQATLRDPSERWLKTITSVIADLDVPQIFVPLYKCLWLSHESSLGQMFWIICFQEQALVNGLEQLSPTRLLPGAPQISLAHRYPLPCEPGWAAAQFLMALHGMGNFQVLIVSQLHSHVFLRMQQHLVIKSLHMRKFPHCGIWSALVAISPLFQSADHSPS